MIVQKEFLNKIRDFGLNSYESKLWTALLSRGVSTAGELSDIANVPRSRSYDVLESLEKKGFIIMKLGKPIRYTAVPPSEVLERVKKKIQAEAKTQEESIEKLKKSEILRELNTLHNQGMELIDPTSLSGILKGRENLYAHIESAIKNAEKTFSLVTTEQGLLRKKESLLRAFEKAKARGVKISISAPLSKDNAGALEAFSKIADVRDSGDFSGRLCIVDSKSLTFMIMDDSDVHPSYDIGIWITSPFFANTMESMFQSIWGSMKPARN